MTVTPGKASSSRGRASKKAVSSEKARDDSPAPSVISCKSASTVQTDVSPDNTTKTAPPACKNSKEYISPEEDSKDVSCTQTRNCCRMAESAGLECLIFSAESYDMSHLAGSQQSVECDTSQQSVKNINCPVVELAGIVPRDSQAATAGWVKNIIEKVVSFKSDNSYDMTHLDGCMSDIEKQTESQNLY